MARYPVAMSVLVLMLAASTRNAHAQDAHYWTNQYGPRAELVGGLVVGSLLDLSATYYNPGAVAFSDQSSLVLSTTAYELLNYQFDDAAPEGLDLGSRRLRPAPSMFAVQVSPRNSKHRLALSTLTRHDLEIEAGARRFPTTEQIDTSGSYVGALEATADTRLSEGWAGFTWAYALSRRVGIGATTYLAIRSHKGRSTLLGQVVDSSNLGLSVRGVDEFYYWNVRALWKLGIALDFTPLTVGATVTTPSINVLGEGELLTNHGLTADTGVAVNELAANFQNAIPSTYKSTPAVALGASYRLGRTTLYGTAELFGNVDRYTVLDAESFVGQTTGDTISIDLTHSLRSVFNWGLGVEQQIGQRWELYGAFFTDRSAFPEGRTSQMAFSTWDIMHASAGGAVRLGNADLTVGFSYGWGSDTIEPPWEGVPEAPLTQVRYSSLKVLFGLTVGL